MRTHVVAPLAALVFAIHSACTGLAGDVAIENDLLRLTLSPNGCVTSLFDRKGAKEYGVRAPLASVRKGGARTAASTVAVGPDGIRIGFGASGITARVAVETRPDHLLFRLEEVHGAPDELVFLQVQTVAPKRASWGSILWFADWCLGIVEGEPETRTAASRGKTGRLSAGACAEPGIGTHRVALYGCAARDIRKVVGGIERAFGIPIGIDAKSNDDNRRSYLMTRVAAQDASRLTEYARRGGFGSILMVIGSWADYGRKYQVPERSWPGGLPQLKSAVDAIHAAGMKAGAHLFASKVPKRGDYTSPVPDPRLYKDHSAVLARDMDARTDRIVTREPPSDWPRLPGTRDIQVDDELITYVAPSLDDPPGFVGCTRGAYGTRATAHRAGATLRRPVTDESRGIFIIDQKSDLPDEIAANIARTYDAAGFDWLYFDGAEDVPPPAWYTMSVAQLKVLRRLARPPVIVQNAGVGPFGWHYTTRRGQRDYFWISMSSKDEVDDAIERSVPGARDSLMAADIGWFQWRNPTPENPQTQIDEFEYLYTKALGADVAVSVQASADRIETHPQRDAILHVIARLEELRLARYFPESVRREVLAPHTDFLLVTDRRGRPHLKRARELPFVARTSREVRAMIAEPVDGAAMLAIWPVLRKVHLDVALLPDQVEFTDYSGRALPVEILPGSIVRIPVADRVYMRNKGMPLGTIRMAFRQAVVTPMPAPSSPPR